MKLQLFSESESDRSFSMELAAQLDLEWGKCGELREIAGDRDVSLLVLDHALATKSLPELEGLAKALPDLKIHVITDPETDNADELGRSPFTISGIIVRRYKMPWKAARQYSRALLPASAPSEPSLERFGFASREIHRNQIAGSSHRDLALANISRLLGEAGCQSRLAETIVSAVEEVLMNALLDAQLERNAPPDASSAQAPVDLVIGLSRETFAFSITDHHGTLRSRVALQHLLKGFTNHQEVHETRSGAGLGLSLVFRAGASLVFRCVPGRHTEVSLLFERAPNLRELKGHFQFACFQIG